MNLADLTAKVQANKQTLAVAGAAGVAGLALLRRRKAGGDVGNAGSGGEMAGTAGGSLAAPNGQVVYSSEASDVYNAVQPQLSTIGTQLTQLLAAKDQAAPKATIPVPAAPKPTTPASQVGYYRVAGTRTTYYQDAQGRLDMINKAEGDALKKAAGGKLKITDMPKDSAFWRNRSFLGSNAIKFPGATRAK